MTENTFSALDNSLEFNTLAALPNVEEFNDVNDGKAVARVALAARLKTTLKFAAMAGIGVAGLTTILK
ncbi:MAG: hypothetical protein EOM30_07200 [Clostridia bacterium]|jgi:hypothetical protein|nr:hypothetical protein [Clostridia bacterium]NLS85289.1 hypothetical protein [Oscillospiraceae bacterium]